MKRHIAVLAFLVALAGAAEARAVTIIEPAGSHFPYQRWADESKMPTPAAAITLIETSAPQGCPGREESVAACTAPWEAKIWAAPEMLGRVHPRETFYHELGHNVDYLMLPEWMRVRFMALLDLSGPWSIPTEPPLAHTPDEIFAIVYAECAVKPRVALRPSLGAGPIFQGEPTGGRRLHNSLCRMLARL